MIKIFKYIFVFTIFSINLQSQPIPHFILDQENEEVLKQWCLNETDYPNLSIILNNQKITKTKANFINTILANYRITTLNLAYCIITKKNLNTILDALLSSKVIMLDLSGLDVIDIEKAAKTLSTSSIKILKLSNCKINNTKIINLFESFNKNLISLNLSKNFIGNKGAIFLFKKVFKNNLNHLDLSHNKLSDESLKYFIENHQYSKLKSLSLAYNPINDQNLLQNLLQTKTLSSIYISGISLIELVQSIFMDADSRDKFLNSLGPQISLLNIRNCCLPNHFDLLLENAISRLGCCL